MWVLIAAAFISVLFALPQIHYEKKRREYLNHESERKYCLRKEKKISEQESELSLCDEKGFELAVSHYRAKDPKAAVLLAHGALEHHKRYREFIVYLNQNGYPVIAFDHRGHGKSISENYPKGYMDMLEECIADMRAVLCFCKELYPGKKIYMIGHSMGSMFARVYLQKYDRDIEKLVLSGTVCHHFPAAGAAFLARAASFYFGEKRHSFFFALLNKMEGKDRSWISYNEENLREIAADPLIVKRFRNKSNAVIFEVNARLKAFSQYSCKNPSLQILSISGEDDVLITGGRKGLEDTMRSLRRIGYQDLENRVYRGMRHEVLREKEREIVYRDVIAFFEKEGKKE